MITGAYFLGKKAKKSYRQRQAKKAAEQLTNPLDIVDPSDEIRARAPPSSPTLSSSSSTSLEQQTESLCSGCEHSPVIDKKWEHYAQRVAIDVVGPEQPPSYEETISAGSEDSTWVARHTSLPPQQLEGTQYNGLRTSQSRSSRRSECSTCHRSMHTSSPTTPRTLHRITPGHAAASMTSRAMIDTQPSAVELPGSATSEAIVELPASDTIAELPTSEAAAEPPSLETVAELPTSEHSPIRAESSGNEVQIAELEATKSVDRPSDDKGKTFPLVELPAGL